MATSCSPARLGFAPGGLIQQLLLAWAAALVLVLLLTGCSGGDPPAETVAGASENTAAPEACTVVTAADVEEVLSVAAKVQGSDQLQTIAAASLCSYEVADDARNLVSVMVRVGPPGLDAATNLKQYVDGIKVNMGDAYRMDPVQGLSGPAVWNADMKQLTVFKGRVLAIVTMLGEEAEPLTAAKALGEKALSKL
jgi:hypothetical protein